MSLRPDQVTAVILAGGFGTRVRHLLADVPKPMAPVEGRPFIEWVVRYLAREGIRRVLISTGHLGETVGRHFAGCRVRNVSVRCIAETKPLGTAGGFLNAIRATADETSSAWLALNGDSLAIAPLEQLFRGASEPGVEGAILGIPMSDASRYGTIAQADEGLLSGFREKQAGAGVINAGVYLFRAELLARFPPRTPLSFEVEVFPALIADRARLKVCVTRAPFLDIGTPESLPQAATFIGQNRSWFQND